MRIHLPSARHPLTHPTPSPKNTPSHHIPTYFFGSSKIPSASNLLLASSNAQV